VLLTILGCSGSVPGPGAASSSYLLEADGFRLVVDFGSGALGEVQRRMNPFAIDALLLSHLHPDHCADVASLAVWRRYQPAPEGLEKRRLPLYAPSAAPWRFAAQYAPDEAELAQTDLSDVYDFAALRPEKFAIGPFQVTAMAVNHECEAYGFRIEHDGKTLAYTGDTGWCDQLVDLASGTDLVMSEASWTDSPDRPKNLHLSGREAGALAARGEARKLLLTHIPPWTDPREIRAEAAAQYFGDIAVAQPGAEYLV
jgi:ribonuclease BN (tRNA processing enzyme)